MRRIKHKHKFFIFLCLFFCVFCCDICDINLTLQNYLFILSHLYFLYTVTCVTLFFSGFFLMPCYYHLATFPILATAGPLSQCGPASI